MHDEHGELGPLRVALGLGKRSQFALDVLLELGYGVASAVNTDESNAARYGTWPRVSLESLPGVVYLILIGCTRVNNAAATQW